MGRKSADAAADAMLGRTIGGCRIVATIGRGAMATVYKAMQISLDRLVALKLLDEGWTADERAVPRVFREARAAARLVHANVVQVYDVGVDQGLPYFVMEYVEGETLYDRIRREGRIPADPALEIVRQAAMALMRAQEFGIVHRDIKPANIMLSLRGEMKLADFGLAKAIADTSVTRSGEMGGLGTPYYMSPEQVEGRPLDVRSDIYSLGATFYHMVTGRPPFQGSSTAAILMAHVSEPLVPASRAEPAVPRAVSDLIGKMMEKDPRDRYLSARALIAAVSGVKRAFAEGTGDRPKPRTDLNPAVGTFDRRAYRRISADFVVDIREVEGDKADIDAVREQVKDLSRGGLFVESKERFPVGSVVRMSFRLAPRGETTHALGVVRWTSAGPGHPGMGVQFVRIGMPSDHDVDRYVDEHAEGSIRKALARTPLHRAFLRLHASLVGEALRTGEIASRLGSSEGLIQLVLGAFAEHGMVSVQRDIVQFLAPDPEDRDLSRAIDGILAENGAAGPAPARPTLP